MGTIVFFIEHTYPLVVTIMIGGVVYGGLLVLTGAITIDELRKIKGAVFERAPAVDL